MSDKRSDERPATSQLSVVALSGGVGGARLVHGLAAALPAEALTVIVNTGDDFTHWGLTICPDLDTVMYTLSGLSHVERGWGLAEESFGALEMIKRYGGPAWFQLGDRDLGTHIARTHALSGGQTLSQVTDTMCRALGVGPRVSPMSDHPQPTHIVTRDRRELIFQDWFVRERCQPAIARIETRGDHQAAPAAIDALAGADLVVLCPSNPYVSIDPILRMRGIREAIGDTPAVAVSPIVGGRAVKGPLAEMIPALAEMPPSAAAVLAHYRQYPRLSPRPSTAPLISGFVVERGDAAAITHAATDAGPALLETDIVMRDVADRERLAREVLAFGQTLCHASMDRSPGGASQ